MNRPFSSSSSFFGTFFSGPLDVPRLHVGCLGSVGILGEAVGADAVSGFGLHLGDLLLIPETDVHWGDAVNTASKLGQATSLEKTRSARV